MIDKRPVDGDELQVFDLRLGKKQSVEGIARRWLRLSGGKDVLDLDTHKDKTRRFEIGRNFVDGQGGREFSNPCLDGYFPKTGGTDDNLSSIAGDCCVKLRVLIGHHAITPSAAARTKCVSSSNLAIREAV